MLKHIEMTGKNQEDAISRALVQLGMDRDDVSVEVLELGKTGFLGIGSVPAKVRVSYEVPDEIPEEPATPSPAVEQEPQKKEPVLETDKPKYVKGFRPKEAKGVKEKKQPKIKNHGKGIEENRPAVREDSPSVLSTRAESGEDDVTEKISNFMTGLFQRMDVDASPQITRDGDVYEVVLQGKDLGCLIGRRGETLDSIQQLTGYAVNRNRSKRVRIHVDAENYRAKREESLQRLANKMAARAIRYRRSVTLEPMNAYERHVIHAALQDHPSVTTYSTGVEPNRRTVVSYDPDKV